MSRECYMADHLPIDSRLMNQLISLTTMIVFAVEPQALCEILTNEKTYFLTAQINFFLNEDKLFL